VSTTTGPLLGELPTLLDQWKQIEPAVADDTRLRERYARGFEFLSRLSPPALVTHSDVRPANALISDGRVTVMDFDEPTWAWPPYDLARMMLDDDARPSGNTEHLTTLKNGYRRGNRTTSITDADIKAFLDLRVLLMYAWSLQDSETTGSPWLTQLRSLLL
jgi:Ser/Thr protein kinase RdoA (MazF antagonist)